MLATHLANQNSAAFLTALPTVDAPLAGSTAERVAVSGNASVRATELPRNTSEFLKVTGNKLSAVDPTLVSTLKANQPARWPTTAVGATQVLQLQTVPVNSAVVIAGTLDLTEQQLVVEPNVDTLYIIAETVICGNNAAVTWRRPGGSTPGRADNPDHNGRDFPGIQTKQDSARRYRRNQRSERRYGDARCLRP